MAFLPPRSKASEDYVFTGVCHSVNSEGWGLPWEGGGLPWEGRGSALGGVCIFRQIPLNTHLDRPTRKADPQGRHPRKADPPQKGIEPENTVNERAVCILLECIFVAIKVLKRQWGVLEVVRSSLFQPHRIFD